MPETIQTALSWAQQALTKAHIDPDGARYVLEMRLNVLPSMLEIRRREALPDSLWQQYQKDVKRLLNNEPAQYIVGVAPFFGDLFNVNPAVLIPRFETEELVAWCSDEQKTATTGLDLGCGSGAIGLTLAKQLPQTAMTLSDISKDALKVAAANAEKLQRRVKFVRSDLFADLADQRFDFIITNLPYIAADEKPVMDQSTLLYEPHLALFAEDQGLALFKRFADSLSAHLHAGGAAYLEFGYHQKPALAKLFAQKLPTMKAEFRKDMAGLWRMVKLQAPYEKKGV